MANKKPASKKPALKRAVAAVVTAVALAAGAGSAAPAGAESTVPEVLLGYQRAWVAETAAVAIWEKSRRIGASWCDACDSVLEAAAADGQDALYIGYSEDMTREYIDDCAMWAKAFHHAAEAMQEVVFVDTDNEGKDPKEIKAFRIDFPNGKKILALSSRPRSIRGKQGKVTIDEAAFHDDLPGLLKAALALLMWGGKIRILSSHNGADNYFNQIITDCRAGKFDYAVHRTTLDDALADGLYERICLVGGQEYSKAGEAEWRATLLKRYGEFADEELFCIPRDSSGTWLGRALIESCMVDGPILRWKSAKGFVQWPEHLRIAEANDWCEGKLQPLLRLLDPAQMSFFGEDFGRLSDLTVLAPAQRLQNLRLRVPFIVELGDMPFEQQKQILFYLVDRLPRFMAGALDAGGNGQYLAEVAQQRYGLRIEQIKFSETWYRENTAPFKAAFEDRAIELPRDADVLDDLRAFQMVRGVPCVPEGRKKQADGTTRHGDAGIALLLAHYASRMDITPMEFESVGTGRQSGNLDDYRMVA